MKKIQVLICKIAGFLLKLFGRGSNFPGVLALKFDKNILSYFKMPKIVIAVTGSAGKGSTSTIISDALRKDNKNVGHIPVLSRDGQLVGLITRSSLLSVLSEQFLEMEVSILG